MISRCKRSAVSRSWLVLRSLLLLLLAGPAGVAQDFTQRGYFESRNFIYPQTAPGDSGRLVSEGLLRWEAGYKFAAWLRGNLSLDARTDSHRQFEREPRLDWRDRSLLRPAFSARRFSLILNRSNWTIELGRQFIRWGKADLLNPTDRFAPRDFLNLVNTDYLGVTATRATWERGGNTLDFVWAPIFTPSRTPLLAQRWAPLPEEAESLRLRDFGARYPQRHQAGLRFNRIGGSGYELSLSYFEGNNHLPLFDTRLRTVPDFTLDLQRYYAHMRMYGADAAVPLRWFTLKGEAAFFSSHTDSADHYLQYVVQAERQSGEWFFVGGYAGEYVTLRRSQLDFAPDRGIARTFLGRASYNLDANRSIAWEGALRQNGTGGFARFEYSHMLGSRWRATASFAYLAGREDDFFGQFRRNSHAALTIRYSF